MNKTRLLGQEDFPQFFNQHLLMVNKLLDTIVLVLFILDKHISNKLIEWNIQCGYMTVYLVVIQHLY